MPFHDFLIAVPRSYIEIAGDSDTALFLAQLDYWSLRCSNPEGWVYKSHADWNQELGLSRRLVDRARRKLVALGVIEQTYRIVRGRRIMHFRINREALHEALRAIGAVDPVSAQDNASAAGHEGPDMNESANPPCAEAPAWDGAAGQHGMASSANAETETTSETTADITAETTGGGNKAVEPGTHGAGPPPESQQERQKSLQQILQALPVFNTEPEPARLHELMVDYPDEATTLELKKFVEYWRRRSLQRPWLALRNWLDRTRRMREGDHLAQATRNGLSEVRGPSLMSRRRGGSRIPRDLPEQYTPPPIYGDEVELPEGVITGTDTTIDRRQPAAS